MSDLFYSVEICEQRKSLEKGKKKKKKKRYEIVMVVEKLFFFFRVCGF